MKEQIYTIPVMDVYNLDCECPLCELETKLENEYVEYVLGASLMEPDSRKQTNEKGFCRKHVEMLYNKEENRLGFGLILDTHMNEQNSRLKKIIGSADAATGEKSNAGLKGLFSKGLKGDQLSSVNKIISFIDKYEDTCYICDKLDYTMQRYIDVIFYLYFEEKEFKKLFEQKKGYCLPHLKQMLLFARDKVDSAKAKQITEVILAQQLGNMQRINDELNWFTKKFDYRYKDEPWGNSKDSIPRAIRKLDGPCRFK